MNSPTEPTWQRNCLQTRVDDSAPAAKHGTSEAPAAPSVLMLLTNAYDPDPRVRQEAVALLKMGLNVSLVAWDRDRARPPVEEMDGVRVRRVYLRSTHGRGNTQLFFYAAVYCGMFWAGWRQRFDAVHCHDLDTLPLGFALAKLRGKPLVYDAHESFPDMLEGSISPRLKAAIVWIENLLIRRTDLLITVGEKLRACFARRGAKRSTVVGNWKSLRDYEFSPQENEALRKRLGVPPGALLIVCITQLLRDRKLEELLEAVADLPDVYVAVGGKGVLEPLVGEWAARNPRIIYVGFVENRAIPAYTCAADAIYYGFDPANPNARYSAPNKLFEALAAGRPLITGDFGEIADVVRQARCGCVLEAYTPTNIRAAIATLQDHAVRAEMGANAKRFGQAAANAEKGEEILNREYAALLPRFVSRAAASEVQSNLKACADAPAGVR